MKGQHDMEKNKIYHGNNLDILKTFEDNSIDSIVTDPPYGISFMNKKWDYDVPTVEFWREALRVLKPGGHALVACGTRTQHRMAVNLEDAGFEIRDIVAWVYGSGFPKSMDVSKALDRHLGAEREVVGRIRGAGTTGVNGSGNQTFVAKNKYDDGTHDITAPATDQAKQWQGWGTALKPAMELWTLCRKPLQGTVANNVLKYGVGGINIDGCRIGDEVIEQEAGNAKSNGKYGDRVWSSKTSIGRFPANFIHDGSEEVVKLFPSAGSGNGTPYNYSGKEYNNKDTSMFNGDKPQAPSNYNDSGSAARFYYTAKASQTERNWGLGEFDESVTTDGRIKSIDNAFNRGETKRRNIHPTVKPIDLMRYLVRLITPKGGVCLDPFMGSGTTAVACKAEKFDYIGCELEEEYIKISEARIKAETVVYNIFDFMGDGDTGGK